MAALAGAAALGVTQVGGADAIPEATPVTTTSSAPVAVEPAPAAPVVEAPATAPVRLAGPRPAAPATTAPPAAPVPSTTSTTTPPEAPTTSTTTVVVAEPATTTTTEPTPMTTPTCTVEAKKPVVGRYGTQVLHVTANQPDGAPVWATLTYNTAAGTFTLMATGYLEGGAADLSAKVHYNSPEPVAVAVQLRDAEGQLLPPACSTSFATQ